MVFFASDAGASPDHLVQSRACGNFVANLIFVFVVGNRLRFRCRWIAFVVGPLFALFGTDVLLVVASASIVLFQCPSLPLRFLCFVLKRIGGRVRPVDPRTRINAPRKARLSHSETTTRSRLGNVLYTSCRWRIDQSILARRKVHAYMASGCSNDAPNQSPAIIWSTTGHLALPSQT